MIDISPQQALFMLRLSFEPKGARPSAILDGFDTKQRTQLVHAGLIVVGKDPDNSRAKFAVLTEAGYEWVSEHLDTSIPKSNASHTVLIKLLSALKSQISAGKFSYADIVRASAAGKPTSTFAERTPDTALASSCAPVIRRILDACRDSSGDGIYNTRIRLADIRSRLTDLPRQEIDRALTALERDHSAAFMPLDDPREILPADEQAALPNSLGNARHILYLSRPE